MKESISFQSVIAAALVMIAERGGITARALPCRFSGIDLSEYKGSNVLLLALAGQGLNSSVWGTPNALRESTGNLIAKGQKSLARIIFAGMKNAPEKKEDTLVVHEPEDTSEEAVPKGKIRVYKAIPVFNACQLNGAQFVADRVATDLGMSRSTATNVMAQALDERIRHPGPGEKPLDQRLADGVMALAECMLDWRSGKQATMAAGWFEKSSDLLTIAGVAQSCVNALNLQPGFHAYGVPALFDPAEEIERMSSASARPVEAAAVKTATPQVPDREMSEAAGSSFPAEAEIVDLGW